MSLALAGCAVVFFSVLAFWKFNYVIGAVLFMLTAGSSAMLGFYWYDVYTTNIGLGISLMIITYSIACIGFAFRCIFWKERVREE